jgi:eukaryotic-like serine/threonine-protein kinase
MGFFDQLRERRFVQIALPIAGVGWAVLEVTDQLADRGIVPELVYKMVLIWVILAIPAALLIAWNHGEKGKQKAPASEIMALVVLALIALGMSTSTVSRERSLQNLAAAGENPLEMRSIAVLYFQDNTGGEYQYLADGLTEDLIAELSQVQGLTVVSRNGSALFRGIDVPADSIARVLNAGTIVDGSVEKRGERIRVNIRIHEGQYGELWKRTAIDLDPAQALAVRDSVSASVSRLLREWLRDEVRLRQTAANTRNPAAWSLLQRAERTRKDAEVAVSDRDLGLAVALFSSADSLLADAADLDRAWADPVIARAAIAYRRARLLQTAPDAAMPFVETALTHADEALRRSRTSAAAWESRGTTRYFKWLLGIVQDPREAETLFEAAREDLETAVRYDASLAAAYATLSHLYTQTDISSAVVAAQQALSADAFLEVADLVRWRLFQGQVDLGHFTQAKRTCDEGSALAPSDFRFVSCHLRLMVTPLADAPSVDSAWLLLARQDELVPSGRAEFERVQGEMFVAGAIARAARRDPAGPLQDSARAVLQRASARADQRTDPTRHVLGIEAFIWTLVGDRDRAVAALQQLAAADPSYFGGSRTLLWWWRDLEQDARFRRLAGLD